MAITCVYPFICKRNTFLTTAHEHQENLRLTLTTAHNEHQENLRLTLTTAHNEHQELRAWLKAGHKSTWDSFHSFWHYLFLISIDDVFMNLQNMPTKITCKMLSRTHKNTATVFSMVYKMWDMWAFIVVIVLDMRRISPGMKTPGFSLHTHVSFIDEQTLSCWNIINYWRFREFQKDCLGNLSHLVF